MSISTHTDLYAQIKNKPLVSVILCVYNPNLVWLKECIDSVLQQTYTNFEFIIVNDGSTDPSVLAFISNLCLYDQRVNYYSHSNIGLTKSLNLAISRSTGHFIARIDADDIWHRSKLEIQITHLTLNPQIIILSSSYRIIDTNSVFSGQYINCFILSNFLKLILLSNPFPHSSLLFRRIPSTKSKNVYCSMFYSSQDKDFILRNFFNYGYSRISSLPAPLVYIRKHQYSISTDPSNKQQYYSDLASILFLLRLRKHFIDFILPSSLVKNNYSIFYFKRILSECYVSPLFKYFVSHPVPRFSSVKSPSLAHFLGVVRRSILLLYFLFRL